ncbi:AAA family ATPase [Gimesia aquarii]|uniref:Putative amino-acid ABC transporter ATP-binding protein YecC n=1 Tax=Gimesia aquarii TaxID=2527964 RepID=A0A517VNY9_9PLAN|nr:AAA family ATPase [Gimesia aquarii]QDT94693.1 putative amino-acid ABC transporter ATP-binding protein YecC [Gimesia aquarii]
MSRVDIIKESNIVRTPRVMQLEGIFGIAVEKKSRVEFSVELPLNDHTWNIGLIVGPSGCGKTTIAKTLFHKELIRDFKWFENKSILDSFPKDMGIKEITGLLSSVGFSSPPSWLRPFRVLSNGEQFRVTIARALAEQPEFVVIDEFTSAVDRTVAQIGSSAIAKSVRRRQQKFIAVTCHYDIIDWLNPDWIYQPASEEFQWRYERQSRPPISLKIINVHRSAWSLFRKHHYLDSTIHKSANCFIALVDDKPAAFTAVIHFPHKTTPSFREHRTVCLPDFQGVGIGNAMSEYVASLYVCKKPYTSVTGHPAMIRHRARSSLWRMTRKPSTVQHQYGLERIRKSRVSGSAGRITASFQFIGAGRKKEAMKFGLI